MIFIDLENFTLSGIALVDMAEFEPTAPTSQMWRGIIYSLINKTAIAPAL